ncbi:MAG: thiamine diphosphokinase [Treponema sp.]|nr:thiamine diphosphokinase [Treponema sp.]
MQGLAFIGGEGPEPGYCHFLAQEADIIVAADSGLKVAENAGVKPDWIVGDMDSLDSLKRLEKYPAERVRRFPKDKDNTDTELALDLLWEMGCTRVVIAGGGGGRLDHLLALRSLFEREKFPDRWVTDMEDVRCLDSSLIHQESSISDDELNLDMPAGTQVSIFPLGEGYWEAESSGLRWPLNSLNWNRGSFGISNRTVKENFSIRVIRGRFMIIVPLFNMEEDVS